MPSYTFATGVPSIVPAVYATSDTGEASNLNTDDAATASTGVLTLTLDAGDYYAKWRWEGDTHTVGGEVANPAGVQSLGELSSGGSSPVIEPAVFTGSSTLSDVVNGSHLILTKQSGPAGITVDVDGAITFTDAAGVYLVILKAEGDQAGDAGIGFLAGSTPQAAIDLPPGGDVYNASASTVYTVADASPAAFYVDATYSDTEPTTGGEAGLTLIVVRLGDAA